MGIATKTTTMLQTGMDQAWNALPGYMSGIGLVLGAAVALYFVFTMLSYMWTGEASKLPIMDLFKRFFFLVLMCTFALNAEFYVKNVKDPVLAIPDQVGKLVSMADLDNNSIIDSMSQKNYDLLAKQWKPVKEMGLFDVDFGVIGRAIAMTVVVGILGTAFVVISAAYLLIAKIMINVVLIIGPAFIMFGFFPPTREYMMKWVGVILNYIFLVVIYSAVFTLLHNVLSTVDFNQSANLMDPADKTAALAAVLMFVYLLFLGVILAVPAMASSLTGGVGISPFGQMAQLLGPLSKMLKQKPKIPGGGNTMGRTG